MEIDFLPLPLPPWVCHRLDLIWFDLIWFDFNHLSLSPSLSLLPPSFPLILLSLPPSLSFLPSHCTYFSFPFPFHSLPPLPFPLTILLFARNPLPHSYHYKCLSPFCRPIDCVLLCTNCACVLSALILHLIRKPKCWTPPPHPVRSGLIKVLFKRNLGLI